MEQTTALWFAPDNEKREADLILEGIVTTVNDDGSPNISPMGPIIDPSMSRLILRPFRSSTTYHNLKRLGDGVFHVTDDVDLFARAAVGKLTPLPPTTMASAVEGYLLMDACRWYAFRVDQLHDEEERTRIECRVVDQGRVRDFLGFNRAKHAVIEAAILATRLHLIPAEEVRSEFDRLGTIVGKTAGPQESRAFEFLNDYVRQALNKLC